MATSNSPQASGNSSESEEATDNTGTIWTVERTPINLLNTPVSLGPQPHVENRAVTRLTTQNQGNFLGQMVEGFENSYGPPGPPRVIPANLQAQHNQFLASMALNHQHHTGSQGQMGYWGGQQQGQNGQMPYQQGYSYMHNGQLVYTGNYGQQQPGQHYQGNQVWCQDHNGNWFQMMGQHNSGQVASEPQNPPGSSQQAENQSSAQAQSQGQPRRKHRSSHRSRREG